MLEYVLIAISITDGGNQPNYNVVERFKTQDACIVEKVKQQALPKNAHTGFACMQSSKD